MESPVGFVMQVTGISIVALYLYINWGVGKEPSKLQRIAEKSWQVFKRIMCFTGAIAVMLPIFVLPEFKDKSLIKILIETPAFFIVALVFVYIGIKKDFGFSAPDEPFRKNKDKYK